MDNKFYIKQCTNNQVTKVDKNKIIHLNENFNTEINEQNLISLLRKIEEIDLGNYLSDSKFSKLPFAVELVQNFTLYMLLKVKELSNEEFNNLLTKQKFFSYTSIHN